jgi:hypothetical protein
MYIIKTYGWSRRDFSYDCKCEHCGAVRKDLSGYDDNNYYENVIPNIKCNECNESTNSKKSEQTVLKNKSRYDENLVM